MNYRKKIYDIQHSIQHLKAIISSHEGEMDRLMREFCDKKQREEGLVVYQVYSYYCGSYPERGGEDKNRVYLITQKSMKRITKEIPDGVYEHGDYNSCDNTEKVLAILSSDPKNILVSVNNEWQYDVLPEGNQ